MYPDPFFINKNFEIGTIQVINLYLGNHVIVRGEFYNLCQNTDHKIQNLVLK